MLSSLFIILIMLKSNGGVSDELKGEGFQRNSINGWREEYIKREKEVR